jgi:hypothetical protein
MLSAEQVHAHFFPVVDLGGGLLRGADEMPKATYYSYFLVGHEVTPFLVSQDRVDDAFARLVLTCAGPTLVTQLELSPLPVNAYGLTHLLRAPHNYHRELRGRLDVERPQTTLCIPIHRAEFTGDENVEEFQILRRDVVATSDWAREPAPKISLRFDNTLTGGGTNGEGYVFAGQRMLLHEIENLAGDLRGFIEIVNFRKDVLELLSISTDAYSWISNRDDESATKVQRSEIASRIVQFLTA